MAEASILSEPFDELRAARVPQEGRSESKDCRFRRTALQPCRLAGELLVEGPAHREGRSRSATARILSEIVSKGMDEILVFRVVLLPANAGVCYGCSSRAAAGRPPSIGRPSAPTAASLAPGIPPGEPPHESPDLTQGDVRMRLNTLFAVFAVVYIIFGLGFLLAPEMVLGSYSAAGPSAGEIGLARLLGAFHLGYAVLAWLARSISEPSARRKVVLSILVATILGLVLFLKAVLIDGGSTAPNWSNVILAGAFVLAYGYFYFTKRD